MDTVPVGHVHKRNAKFADLDEILVDIESTLTSVIHRFQENQALIKMQPRDDVWNLPEILVYPGRPQVDHNGTMVHSDAIEISTNREDSQRLKWLIQHSADLGRPRHSASPSRPPIRNTIRLRQYTQCSKPIPGIPSQHRHRRSLQRGNGR
jgi:hypothetical protein